MKNQIKKATSINLLNFKTPQMRAFHLSWLAFFLCFFGWFGIAPLMAVVREELELTKSQIGNIIISSVAITVIARLFIGWLCDRIGPRITYTYLLIIGAFPVMLIGLSNSYESFLIFRLAIGAIGASFVITQYHTSMMFAPNVVGTANATSAGWGNLGGGVTQMVMPMIFAMFVGLGFLDKDAWRYAMVVPGLAMVICGILYYRLTTDFPEGNLKDLLKTDPSFLKKKNDSKGAFKAALKDKRVWALFMIYGACFGVELTINNIAAIYYHDFFKLDLKTAGLIAGLFGLMNIFARSMGGFFGDRAGIKWGLKGRVYLMGGILFFEGLALMLFSQMTFLPFAIASMIVFSLFVQMAEGATYSVVPFVNKKAIGIVSGIVGAGGNAGAVMAGFLFKMENVSYSEGLAILGVCVTVVSGLSLLVRFSEKDEKIAELELQNSLDEKSLELVPVYEMEK
ncbi:MFS transporter [Rhodonellum psychrophilum GCM71 = DSM 17998]|uniref:MFS transporter n=2 Tax=Rhodonellum TaxID=336827 RepID=U5BS81_9BACT|nr:MULTISPECIES: MFS transporter [Rhodonellum]ERM80359.1 MFS transporter [Rhodonellum psychrophilum GCM71 = DSM 17998]MDO9552870.1 MFS transporter [Rhodonellum sp.]SDZ57703.1 MFS transporter, NNP family, nitrate/nitrite transporter [Rhodonellum ikkaensis]